MNKNVVTHFDNTIYFVILTCDSHFDTTVASLTSSVTFNDFSQHFDCYIPGKKINTN